MKNPPDNLTKLLREWNPEPVRAEEVRREVWRRIEKLEPSPWKTWLAVFENLIGRPAVATGLLAIALAMGITIGSVASSSAQTESYLHSVSPFLPQR